MSFNIDYGTSVVALPGKVRDHLDNVGAVELKVLFALADSVELCKNADSDVGISALADVCSCDVEDVRSAIAFWRGAGVLVAEGQKARKSTKKAVEPKADEPQEKATVKAVPPSKKVVERPDELPHYTTEELITLLESRNEVRHYLDECERAWGKTFNTYEVNIILGLVDYLALEWEYVFVLLKFVKKKQKGLGIKPSLHYVEKMAFNLYDSGITDVTALNAELMKIENFATVEGKLRNIFGIGERALTPREKKYFSTWLYEYHFDLEMIIEAYNITVDAKGNVKLPYIDSIMGDWHAKGIRTVSDAQQAQEKFKAENSPKKEKKDNGSFETDDFFKAAVRRSFGDDFEG